MGLALVALAGVLTAPAQAAAPDVVTVDFGRPTGPVHGGATGMLYGLSDPGVPGDALLAGARPRTVARKAPDGDQHPNGDALVVADGFFAAGGEEIVVCMQDVYIRWPYENLDIDDYLAKVGAMVHKVVTERPEDRHRFAWVPFNEPDGIWYQDWARQREKFFAAAREDGYHDLVFSYAARNRGDLHVGVDGREIPGLRAARPGESSSRARVYLPAGVSRIDVRGPDGLELRSLSTVRAAHADTAVHRVGAEQAALAGTAVVVRAGGGSNASGGKYVGRLGNGAGNTLTLERPAAFGAGEYVLVVHYANAGRNTGHAYNTDVISCFLDITETGGGTTRGVFRHNHAWENFRPQATPVTLTTARGALVLGNATAYGPNVDRVELARLVLEVANGCSAHPAGASASRTSSAWRSAPAGSAVTTAGSKFRSWNRSVTPCSASQETSSLICSTVPVSGRRSPGSRRTRVTPRQTNRSDAGSRPAFSAACLTRAMRAAMPVRSSRLALTQPSAMRPARRSATSAVPPSRIGGGAGDGLGSAYEGGMR
jgi:hypothetical protein